MRRIVVYSLSLLAALTLGAVGFEVLETVSIAPRVTMTVLEPSARRDMSQYTVTGRGVSILDADDTTVTVHAWAPTPTVSVFPRGASSITIKMVNIPERATLAESPGVSETRRGLTRVLSVKGTARQDVSYTAPYEGVVFAGLGDTGDTETLEQALITARSLGCDFSSCSATLCTTTTTSRACERFWIVLRSPSTSSAVTMITVIRCDASYWPGSVPRSIRSRTAVPDSPCSTPVESSLRD